MMHDKEVGDILEFLGNDVGQVDFAINMVDWHLVVSVLTPV